MSLNYTAITSSGQYSSDHKVAFVAGKTKTWAIIGFLLLFGTLLIFPPAFIALFVLFIIYGLAQLPKSIRQSKERRQALERFALDNSFSYHHANAIPISDHFVFFKDVNHASHLITGSLDNYSFKYITFLTEGNSDASIGCVALKIDLPVQFPRLFVNLRRNNITGFEPKLHQGLTKQTKYFEGDFHKYYEIEAEKGNERDVLEILSPDVMVALIDHNLFDIYLEGNQLVIYQYNTTEIEYFAFVPSIFSIAELLLKEIDHIQLHRS